MLVRLGRRGLSAFRASEIFLTKIMYGTCEICGLYENVHELIMNLTNFLVQGQVATINCSNYCRIDRKDLSSGRYVYILASDIP